MRGIRNTFEAATRWAEVKDEKATFTRPPRGTRIFAPRLEKYYFDPSGGLTGSPVDRFVIYIVIFSLAAFALDMIFEDGAEIFFVIDCAVCTFFFLDFAARWNYRRRAYLTSWGIYDGGILFLDLVSLLATAVLLYYGTDDLPVAWVVVLRALRLLRLLRLVRLFIQLVRRPEWTLQRISHFRSLGRAIVQTLFWTFIAMSLLLVILAIFTEADVQKAAQSIIRTAFGRLGKSEGLQEGESGDQVDNVEIIDLLYRLFTLTLGLILVTFFTQLMVPIVQRINRERAELSKSAIRRRHAILAVADEASLGAVEEFVQVLAGYHGLHLVLLVPNSVSLDDAIHPTIEYDVVRGDIGETGPWLAADSITASLILVLSAEDEADSFSLAQSHGSFRDGIEPRVIYVVTGDAEAQTFQTLPSGVTKLALEPLLATIEATLWDPETIQRGFYEQLLNRFDRKHANDLDFEETALTVPDDTGERLTIDDWVLRTFDRRMVRRMRWRIEGRYALFDLPEDASELEETLLISSLAVYLRKQVQFDEVERVFVYIRSFQLMRINSALAAEDLHRIRVVPIELVGAFAILHEFLCPGIIFGWATVKKPADCLLAINIQKQTYRSRRDLEADLQSKLGERAVLGTWNDDDQTFVGFCFEDGDLHLVKPSTSCVVSD
mmetsp:Transcript_28895/g.55081  ORF Transcript_28895/g.55081 Transcript_28895/m.55081 type:complete len:664 (-) Transcript_28895:2119-4110(-)